MKVIFLDIDGVLNSEQLMHINQECYKLTGLNRGDVSQVAVERLSRLVHATDAKIVISSSWRSIIKRYFKRDSIALKCEDVATLLRLFAENHLKIFDYTIDHVTGFYEDGTPWSRGYEIREWLSRHEDVTDFVILDDEDFKDWYELKDHLVQTDFYNYGLKECHIEKAIRILGGICSETH